MNKLLKHSKRYYKYYALSLFCPIIIASSLLISTPVSTIAEKAHTAYSFVDSIGINTHLYYGDTTYYQKYQEVVKPKLSELGVRHIRDGGTRNLNGYLDRLRELKNNGISATLIFDPRGGTPEQGLVLVKELGNIVEAVEGPNEYDLSGDNNWVQVLHQYVERLHQLIKSDAQTSALPVLGPSLTSSEAYFAMGNISNFVDYGVLHNYFSGRHPGTLGWGANGYGSIAYGINLASKYAPGKPIITTETGYHNAINTQEEHLAVPESVAEKYIPRMFLEQFNHGIKRTFGYELIDLQSNPKRDISGLEFGLLRNNGEVKPSFVSLKALIQLLKDPEGSQFSPGTLNYGFIGNTSNLHHTLLQKSNGNFYLVLWQEVSGFDVNSKKAIVVPSQKIELVLAQTFAQAKIYSLADSAKPGKQVMNPKQFSLNVSDRPLIIEFSEVYQSD
jgi:hypothetical protein